MKKFMVLGALVAMIVTALALPAFADDLNDRLEDREDENLEELFFDGFFFPSFFFDEDFDEDEDFDGFNSFDGFDGSDFEDGISQETEQEAESGQVEQSFTVTGGGDNSNQCVGIQGVANTGNAQNVTDLIQYGSEAEDFEFDEVGSTIEVSPTNTTSCDQQVNQAASATR